MSNNHKVVRSIKPAFNATTPLTYGSFMEEACVHSNCLDHLIGNYYMLTEEEANDFNNLEDEQANEEASIKTSPGNGLTPLHHQKANRCPVISAKEERAFYLMTTTTKIKSKHA